MTGGLSFDPVVPWAAVVAFAAVGLAAVAVRRDPWLVLARRSVVVLLTVGVLVGPHLGRVSAPSFGPPDYQVVVALDRTTSMAVRDSDVDSRLDQAVLDVTQLARSLDAPIAVVTWGTDVQLRVPATTDDAFLASALAALEPEPPTSGTGSRIDRPVEDLRTLLLRSSSSRPDRAIVLALLSDGENTGTGQERSFDVLSDQLARALVIGYGTDTGGPVPLDPDQPDTFVPDPDGSGPAISRRSEERLEEVAGELDGAYRNREELSSSTMRALLEPEAQDLDTRSAPADVTWLLALALLSLLMFELRTLARHSRELRSLRRAT